MYCNTRVKYWPVMAIVYWFTDIYTPLKKNGCRSVKKKKMRLNIKNMVFLAPVCKSPKAGFTLVCSI